MLSNLLEEEIQVSTGLVMTLIFVYAFLLPLWCSLGCYFADKRGRVGVIWFFLGILLNVFTLPLLFWLPKKEEKKKIDYSKSWTCPHCWEVNDGNDEFCVTCGRKKPEEKVE